MRLPGPEGEQLKVLEHEYYQAMVELRSQREHKAKIESEMEVSKLFISFGKIKLKISILIEIPLPKNLSIT